MSLLNSAFTIFLLATIGLQASATTYYVGKSGSDSISCSQAQNPSTPRLSINAGITCLAAGDTLSIKAGTYNDKLGQDGAQIPSGTAWSNMTTIAHFGSDRVVITGPLTLYSPADHHMTFDGLVFDSSGQGHGEVILVANGANHIRIVNSEVTGSIGAAGIALYGPQGDCQIVNNRVHHNGLDVNLDHGLYVHSPGNVIEGNEFDHNAATGIQFYNGGVDMGTGNAVRGNFVHENGAGIATWDLTDLLVSNNLIVNNATQGLSVNRAPGARFYNNTITGSGAQAVYLSNSSSIQIKNNILSGNNSIYGDGSSIYDLAAGTIKDHNLCDSGCDFSGDPQFMDRSRMNFHLKASSPAIDRGLILSEVPIDFEGTARPQGAGYDIGAYEFASGGTDGSAPQVSIISPTNGSLVQRFL